MGSEQSNQSRNAKDREKRPLRRGVTVATANASSVSATSELESDRCNSPEMSVCSDSDLPYISYTVNRPIGDSPKLSAKYSGGLHRGKSLGSSVGNSPVRNKRGASGRKPQAVASKTGHDIVVVKAAKGGDSEEKDTNLLRLDSIPMFLPIMRGTIHLPGMRDPEVLEKLDPQDFVALCKRIQNYMALCAETVASSQNQITGRIREIDFELCRLVSSWGEKQKQIGKAAEKLSKVSELSRQLNRCHSQLNGTLELMESLNNNLPLESRLEPFVWTTG